MCGKRYCRLRAIFLRALNLRNADSFDYALKSSIQLATAGDVDMNDPLSSAKWAALVEEEGWTGHWSGCHGWR